MKNSLRILALILIIVLAIAILYVGYKTYTIFGFWTIIATFFIELFSAIFLFQLIGSRSQKNQSIIYNPKEWPKFLNFLISLVIAYYLVTILLSKTISERDFIFGIVYVVLLTVLPTLRSVYRLIRDRNDYISISDNSLKYRDNDEQGEYQFANISSVDMSKEGIKLTLKDESTVLIKIGEMNFNLKDAMGAFNEIKARIPKSPKPSEENSSNDAETSQS